ncbi:hypothetical protein HELRODRAFT_171507 [Helobdella robusta]|uniref:Uncharacterized protein n=1 Tax=Helobdella robusta TaxID=6412 RepID=T1F4D0_HELRO|nr:hypothetical protein HELRODRAFT_171507 [Helobdella robusta]ESO05168.1 hypothetical protein HELRODRAFT_171507 [Helobdella robusta]
MVKIEKKSRLLMMMVLNLMYSSINISENTSEDGENSSKNGGKHQQEWCIEEARSPGRQQVSSGPPLVFANVNRVRNIPSNAELNNLEQSRNFELMNELSQLAHDAEVGRRYVQQFWKYFIDMEKGEVDCLGQHEAGRVFCNLMQLSSQPATHFISFIINIRSFI